MNQTEAVNTMKILQKPRQNGEIQYASKKTDDRRNGYWMN